MSPLHLLSLLVLLGVAQSAYAAAPHEPHTFEANAGPSSRWSGFGLSQAIHHQHQLPLQAPWQMNQMQQQPVFSSSPMQFQPSTSAVTAAPAASAAPLSGHSKGEKLRYAQPIVTYSQPIVQKVDMAQPVVQKQHLEAQPIVQSTYRVAPVLRPAALSSTAPTIQKGFGTPLNLGAWQATHPTQLPQTPTEGESFPIEQQQLPPMQPTPSLPAYPQQQQQPVFLRSTGIMQQSPLMDQANWMQQQQQQPLGVWSTVQPSVAPIQSSSLYYPTQPTFTPQQPQPSIGLALGASLPAVPSQLNPTINPNVNPVNQQLNQVNPIEAAEEFNPNEPIMQQN